MDIRYPIGRGELEGEITPERKLHSYSWHCRHHTAQITGLRERRGWN